MTEQNGKIPLAAPHLSGDELEYIQKALENGLCLPSHTLMTEDQQLRIIELIKKVFHSRA